MKKVIIILTAAVFMLSVVGCRTRSVSALESKAEYFVERILSDSNEEDKKAQTDAELGEYLDSLNEQQGEEFGKHLFEKMYADSERSGYGKEFADESLTAMTDAMIGTNGEGTTAFVLSLLECMMQNGSATSELKAAYFVERIFYAIGKEDWKSRLTQIGEEMGEYIRSLNNGQQGEEFGEHFAYKMYKGSEHSGYGKEFADEFLQFMIDDLSDTEKK